MGSTIHDAAIQHWAGKAPSHSNERWLKRALGAGQKRDWSSTSTNAMLDFISKSGGMSSFVVRGIEVCYADKATLKNFLVNDSFAHAAFASYAA